MTVTNCTIVLNRATVRGGGILSLVPSVAILNNSIVAGNTRQLGAVLVPDDLSGPAFDNTSAHNLIGDAGSSGGLINGVNGNVVGVPLESVLDPQLKDNGGPTFTHALFQGSVAIDRGSNVLALDAFGIPLVSDQRQVGFSRIFNAVVDIGAYEWQPQLSVRSAKRLL
jgi:hypothetical protein